MAGQVQVAHRIEDLVADELVGVAQAVVVDHAEFVEHDRVVHRATEAEVALAHEFEIAHETEGARAADFADVALGRELDHRARLRRGNGRMIEFDGEAQAETVVRLETGDLVAVAHFHGLEDADEALGRVLFDDAGRLQQEHEGAGGTVHDRHFGRRQFDVEIVDAQARQRGHQVLDGHRLGALAGQTGAEHGLGHQVGAGGDLDDGIQIDATEHDAGIDRCRAQGQEDLVATVQAHAGGADHVLQGALLGHGR